MKLTSIIIIDLIIIFCSGCTNYKEKEQVVLHPVNIEILLDLSDRVLLENQPQNDILLIKTVFYEWMKIVRQSNLIINSRDKFRVTIAPQKNETYDPVFFMNSLYLDMGEIPMTYKRDSLESFERTLDRKLEKLYNACRKGKTKNEDFYGCDLWKYFNEQLLSDLASESINILIILTDGYFDFEFNPNVLQHGNRSSSTGFMRKLRGMADPLDEFSNGNYGLIKIEKDFNNLNVAAAEINLKSDNLYESELLKAIWTKWMHEMGIGYFDFILKSNIHKSQSRLIDFLNNIQRKNKNLSS